MKNNKIINSTKWSTVTELLAKLVSPIVNMLLARLLTPEAFGIVAAFTIITSFADVFTDAGFQKFIVQHEFKDDKEKESNILVAFWSNMTMSFISYFIIFFFRNDLAKLVGVSGESIGIAVSGIAVILTAFSSVQLAIFRRDFDFKTLFKIRMIAILMPLFVTVPLAFFFRSYWALVVGTLAVQLSNAICVNLYSRYRVRAFFDINIFKGMFSFSMWSLIESISIWLTSYADIFIVSSFLTSYYLGLYRTSMSVVGAYMGIIVSGTIPVLFSALSRTQNNREEFLEIFYNFQFWLSMLIFPLGVGIYFYSDLVTSILLGSQWYEASDMIALWGLSGSLMVIFSHCASEVYRAMGKPKISVIAQWLHIIVLVPVVYIFTQYSYSDLVLYRSLVRLELALVNILLMYYIFNISSLKTVFQTYPQIMASLIMGAFAYWIRQYDSNLLWTIGSVVSCIIVYFVILMMIPYSRNRIFSIPFLQRVVLKYTK